MASRTAAPCGSSTVAFGVTITFILIGSILMRRSGQQAQCGGRSAQKMNRSTFTSDLSWLLILAQTEKDRLTQFPVTRPLRKLHLANEDRIHPMNPPHHRGRDP